MSLLCKPGEPQTLALDENLASARVYKLATPTTIGRIRFRRMIAEAGGRHYGTIPMLGAMRASIEKVFGSGEPSRSSSEAVAQKNEARDALTAAVDAQRTRILEFWTDAGNGKFDALETGTAEPALLEEFRTRQLAIVEGANGLANTQRILIDADPGFAAMVADEDAFPLIRGIVAAQLFMVSWSGIEGECSKGPDALLSEDSLARIPESDLPAIGAKAEAMMALDKAQKKASVSPAPGDSAGGTSST